MSQEKEQFLNKDVDVKLKDLFHVYAVLMRYDEHGVYLRSDKEISFIPYDNIAMIKLNKGRGF